MATTLTGAGIAMTSKTTETPNQPSPITFRRGTFSCRQITNGHRVGRLFAFVQPPSPPKIILEKVKEKIKAAEETCKEDVVSGDYAATWDKVEELSAASHARNSLKSHLLDWMDTCTKQRNGIWPKSLSGWFLLRPAARLFQRGIIPLDQFTQLQEKFKVEVADLKRSVCSLQLALTSSEQEKEHILAE
ncbi:hypothetical protein J5N97_022264 [Dioscorea zingiberensis]|uniref:Uncharacterized protein n=1 Tax=Dioscorea zingiberensis TaxID=325984 RepID=A0A9D5CB75_9LILI|nr:hypothetical protein J5N97_022264 [Dioscorea zingiberensis]